MSLYGEDGRATGRRWPAEFDRSKAASVLPLVPDDGAVLCWISPFGRNPVRAKVHIARVPGDGEFLTLCGRPFLDEEVPQPLPMPLCAQCALQLYTRRRTRENAIKTAAEFDRLNMMDNYDLREEIAQLTAQRDYLLQKLAEHGLLLGE